METAGPATSDVVASPEVADRVPADPGASSMRRFVVYLIAALAVVAVAWSLIEGGERDLWTSPAAAAIGVLRVPALRLAS